MKAAVLLFALLGLAQIHHSSSAAVFTNVNQKPILSNQSLQAGSALDTSFEDDDMDNFFGRFRKSDAVPCCRYKVCPTYLCTRRKRFIRRIQMGPHDIQH